MNGGKKRGQGKGKGGMGRRLKGNDVSVRDSWSLYWSGKGEEGGGGATGA